MKEILDSEIIQKEESTLYKISVLARIIFCIPTLYFAIENRISKGILNVGDYGGGFDLVTLLGSIASIMAIFFIVYYNYKHGKKEWHESDFISPFNRISIAIAITFLCYLCFIHTSLLFEDLINGYLDLYTLYSVVLATALIFSRP